MILSRISMRQLASAGGLALIVLMLAACAPAAPATQVAPQEAMMEAAMVSGDVSDISNIADSVSNQSDNRMIVKNGEISLQVADIDIAIDQVTQVAVDNGGYVLDSQAWANGPNKSASLTIAVQADKFEVAMRRLRESAKEVLRESSSGQDVSAEYVDLQSRLRNLEATRDRIQTFLDQTKNVDEALKVNKQLSDIEAQIEEVKGRMTYLSGRSAYSTIKVDLQVVPAQAEPPKRPSLVPAEVAQSALKTQAALISGIVAALIWLGIVLGPYLLLFGVIIIGVTSLRRLIRKNSAQSLHRTSRSSSESK